ncbi:MAG TPA: twin-arginine translocase TatA/TatE family subunit [Candidatus Sulfotelmatobacter sp.]|nr:twin-arginine translocase TatA/TatE family subunit [Candidatus Sulfotelmatobacter sp.]
MSFSETIFLFFLALIIFGPKKLPEIARQVAKYMNEFKRASNEFKAQIEQEISQLEVEKKQQVLPPSPAPAYTTSRTLTSSPPAVAAPATLAASNDEADSPARDSGSEPVATEAVTAPNSVTSPPSQESHA